MIPQNFADAFERVKELVSIFSQNEERYLSTGYSEAQARLDFIDKFWIALGWDVAHENQTDPYKQEVKVERGVATNEWRKRSDYAFLSPNFRDVRFYVEAKKPHAGIDNPDFYFQTIRYGWNSHTPIAVLTDFEELRVVDCRYKPDIRTAIGHAVLKYHYTDYSDEQKFRTIYYLFSRESVIEGSIENFAKGLPKLSRKRALRGAAKDEHQDIDEAFLKELDEYREELARAFKRSNPELDSEALTEVTQRTLDRLVFMRFLEDKLIETEPLIESLHQRGDAWENFVATSRRLDRVYNGIIFKEHSLLDSAGFTPDGRTFEKISRNLSHTNSPYDFNAIPIHILGSIYERFLGKVIVATDKRARVEEKPEVRKAGGVYYTPEYIVRYIVDNTVGKLIEGKTPEEIRQMRFADIACGSGSFLLGVYDTLLRYHTAYYNKNKRTQNEGTKAGCLATEAGALRLSLLQRRTILLNNIYGVDIDPQAVEVAQLSLYLKLLEDETTASAHQQQMALREALLPSLSKNIICGNSLIGWDITEGKLFDTADERGLNPMNFEDAFPEVMKRGGFDAIVGNPPYVVIGKDLYPEVIVKYLNSYPVAEYKVDLFHLFIQRAIDLLAGAGKLGYIVPSPWLTLKFTERLRKYVIEKTSISEIVIFEHQVFQDANVHTALLFLENGKAEADHSVRIKRLSGAKDSAIIESASPGYVPQKSWAEASQYVFEVRLSGNAGKMVKRLIKTFPALEAVARASLGCQAYNSSKHTRQQIADRVFHSTTKKTAEYLPELAGNDVSRYEIVRRRGEWIRYGPWLHDYRPLDWLEGPRILIREIPARPPYGIQAAYVEETYCNYKTILNVNPSKSTEFSMKYLVGLLNSRLLSFLFPYVSNKMVAASFPRLSVGDLKRLPIRTISFSESDDKARHDRMVQLVTQMLEAKQQLAAAQTERDKTFYESKCASLDRQIDNLVYELYDLTPEEIAIVEEESK